MKYKGHELEIQYLPGSDFTVHKDGTLKPRRPKPADIDFVWVTDPEGFRWVEKTVAEAKKEIDLAKFRRVK